MSDEGEIEVDAGGGEEENRFYTEERWQNWLDRVEDEHLDPEDEESARLLINLQDDAAIAVAKVLSAHEEGTIDDETAAEELARIREIVLAEVAFEDEDALMLIDGVQTSLVPVFYAAEEYVAAGATADASVGEYVHAAADAEAEDDLDAALGYVVQAGTRVIDGDDLDMAVVDELEYGLVAEWVNGLDSLQSALADPEVVEDDD
ncbi:MAG: DUF2150 family protein [Haloferacaceae archaeon]|jgi:hypothetical protein